MKELQHFKKRSPFSETSCILNGLSGTICQVYCCGSFSVFLFSIYQERRHRRVARAARLWCRNNNFFMNILQARDTSKKLKYRTRFCWVYSCAVRSWVRGWASPSDDWKTSPVHPAVIGYLFRIRIKHWKERWWSRFSLAVPSYSGTLTPNALRLLGYEKSSLFI